MESGVTDLEYWVQAYEDAETNTINSRAECERDRDYYDGKQWTDDELAALAKRKQPAIVINRIKPKVDFLLGLERASRTDPKAYPRTPQHERDAESATDSIRYVCENNDFDQVRSHAHENILIEGTGAAEVLVKPGKRGVEIAINCIPWDRHVIDPYSIRRDGKDANYQGVVIWLDLEDAKTRWPNKEEILTAVVGSEPINTTFEDKPRVSWADTNRKRVKIVSMYRKCEGVWKYAEFTRTGFLRDPVVSPYLDEEGEPTCPIESQSAFVDRDGNRYGAVRQFIGIQDEINKRRSKALHLLTVRQVRFEDGAVDDINEARRELAKPDGMVKTNKGFEFEVLQTGEMAAAQFQLLQEAKNEIDAVGANAAMSGKDDRSMSGRALEARQQGGTMEIGPVMDSLKSWQKRIYRQVWNRIRQFWTEERWIRVTDDETNMRWVQLNRPVTVADKLQEQYGPLPASFQGDPRLSQVVAVENQLAELDVDIILDDGPNFLTLQSEQFDLLAQLYQADPNRIPLEVLIEASSLRGDRKKAILERLKGDPQRQAQAMEAQQIQKAQAVAEIKKTEAEAVSRMADADKTAMEARQTERQLMLPAMVQ